MYIGKLIERARQERVLAAEAALQLANMALEQSSKSAEAAAKLLMSAEWGVAVFNAYRFGKLDSVNRQFALCVCNRVRRGSSGPAQWIKEHTDIDGCASLTAVRDKWNQPGESNH